jgi:SAM-dependent methyltransferase
MDLDRISREKEWHNKKDWRENRASTGKFRAIFNKERGTTAQRNKYIFEDIHKDRTIFLDYGCGDGVYLSEMAPYIKHGTGIDISEEEIEKANNLKKSNGISNIEYYVMDAMRTTFNDSTFDMITGNAVLHHLELERSLLEIKRILKEGGRAIFIEPLSTNPVIELYRKLTPDKRTLDEQPLRLRDIRLIKKIFPRTKIEYIGFFTLLAVPLRNMRRFNSILNVLYKIDAIVLHRRSPLKLLAWCCLLVLKN